MKIQFSSDNDLFLKTAIELHNNIISVRSVFHEGNKFYSQIFLDDCLLKLAW